MRKCFASLLVAAFCSVGLMACDTNGTTNIIKSRPDVVVIGDSIFALSGDIEKDLYDLSGSTFKSYAISGAEMTGGFVNTVPAQWAQAKREAGFAGIKTIIMDGGGNDVLISGQAQCSGSTVSSACKTLLQNEVWGPMRTMLDEMQAFGVEHVIYMGYYVTVDTTKKAVNLWSQQQIAAKIATWEQELQENGDITVHYVATQPAFEGKNPSSYTVTDGIHPTANTSEIIANLIWDYMQTIDW